MAEGQNQYITDRAVRALFVRELEKAPQGWVADVASDYKSDQAVETYGAVGAAPRMTESKGPLNAGELREDKLTVPNKDYDCTLNIREKDLRRDKTGILQSRIAEQREATYDHWAELISELIEDGLTGQAFDEKAFFATSSAPHFLGKSGNWANAFDVDISELDVQVHGSPTAPSPEELTFAVMAGIKRILQAKNDQGKAMHKQAKKFLVMAPIDFLDRLSVAFSATTLAGAVTNPLDGLRKRFQIDLEFNADLAWTDSLAVLRTDSVRKPFLTQEELIRFKALGPDSEYCTINRGLCSYVAEASRAAAYNDHRFAARVKLV